MRVRLKLRIKLGYTNYFYLKLILTRAMPRYMVTMCHSMGGTLELLVSFLRQHKKITLNFVQHNHAQDRTSKNYSW